MDILKGKVMKAYHMDVDVVDLLVSTAAVVLQDVELLGAGCDSELLGDWLVSFKLGKVSYWTFTLTMARSLAGRGFSYQELGEVVVGDIGQLLAVDLGNDKLCLRLAMVDSFFSHILHNMRLTA